MYRHSPAFSGSSHIAVSYCSPLTLRRSRQPHHKGWAPGKRHLPLYRANTTGFVIHVSGFFHSKVMPHGETQDLVLYVEDKTRELSPKQVPPKQ